jgi:FtsP/CotA-like multicopper oxidase with cupredoxin domain
MTSRLPLSVPGDRDRRPADPRAVRDTVLITPKMGRIRIAFDANNPGRWALHCHNLYHMRIGM